MSTTTIERRKVGREWQTTPIGPNPVAPVPARPPVDPPDVPPRPTRPLWAAPFPGGGNVCEAPPEPLDAQALASLAEARGSDRLVAELAEALGWLDAKIRATCQELVTAHPRTPVVDRLVHMASYRAHYQARALALGEPQGIGLSLPLGLIRYCEHHDPLPQIRHELGQARAELAGIVAEISLFRSSVADDDWYFAWLPPGSRDARPVISEGLIAGGFPPTSDGAHQSIMGSFTAVGRLPGPAGLAPHRGALKTVCSGILASWPVARARPRPACRPSRRTRRAWSSWWRRGSSWPHRRPAVPRP